MEGIKVCRKEVGDEKIRKKRRGGNIWGTSSRIDEIKWEENAEGKRRKQGDRSKGNYQWEEEV